MVPFLDQVKATVVRPSCIIESRHVKPTFVYYARGLIDDPPYRGCYVAVFVRYAMEPSEVWTAYLPTRIAANSGKLIFAQK